MLAIPHGTIHFLRCWATSHLVIISSVMRSTMPGSCSPRSISFLLSAYGSRSIKTMMRPLRSGPTRLEFPPIESFVLAITRAHAMPATISGRWRIPAPVARAVRFSTITAPRSGVALREALSKMGIAILKSGIWSSCSLSVMNRARSLRYQSPAWIRAWALSELLQCCSMSIVTMRLISFRT